MQNGHFFLFTSHQKKKLGKKKRKIEGFIKKKIEQNSVNKSSATAFRAVEPRRRFYRLSFSFFFWFFLFFLLLGFGCYSHLEVCWRIILLVPSSRPSKTLKSDSILRLLNSTVGRPLQPVLWMFSLMRLSSFFFVESFFLFVAFAKFFLT